MQLAILDDYQEISGEYADWSQISQQVQIKVFSDHISEENEIVKRLQDFSIICVMRERTPFPRTLIEKLPNLKLIVSSGMRNLGIDLQAAKDNDVIVCGTKSFGMPTAELTWGLILGLARQIPSEDQNIRLGGWQNTVGVGLEGKTLGIAGLGKLGSRVAEIGKVFGMKVIGWSQNLTQGRCNDLGVLLVGKDELMKNSDFLSIHLILSERTRGLFQRKDLLLMKPTAYIINTARGPIINEEALIEVLQNKIIGGAGIDVYGEEPLPHDHPLRGLKNTIVTPHLGYVEKVNYEFYHKGYVEAVSAFLNGEPKNLINGY